MFNWNKKRGLMITLTVVMLGVGIMCFSTGTIAAEKQPYKGVTIYGLVGAFARFDPLWGPYDGPPYGHPLVQDFERQTGIKVKFTKVIWANIYEKQMLELVPSEGSMSYLTAFYGWYPRFVQYLEPLTKYLDDLRFPKVDWEDTPDGVKLMVTYDDTIYGLPLYVYCPMLGYRKDLYEEFGLDHPETWAQLVENAKKLTVDLNGDGKIDRYGISFVGKKSEIGWWPLSCLYGFGGDIFDKDMRPILDNETGIKSFETFCSLHPYCPPGILSNEVDTCNLQFRDDKIAMYIGMSVWFKQLRELILTEEMKPKLGISPLPTKASSLQGWTMCVPKNAPHKEAGYLFSNWLTSAQTMRAWQFTRTPGPPGLKSVLKDPEVLKLNPGFLALKEALGHARPIPTIKEWSEVQEILRTYYSLGFSGEMTPAAALHQAAEEVRTVMQEAGYYNK